MANGRMRYRIRVQRRGDLTETQLKNFRLGLFQFHALPESTDDEWALRDGKPVEYSTTANFESLKAHLEGLCSQLSRISSRR